MARKKILEYDAKRMIAENIGISIPFESAAADIHTDLDKLAKKNSWMNEKLVVKPDQLFGKRGKHNLVLLNASLSEVKKFIKEKSKEEIEVGKVKGKVTNFIIEPFIKHEKEYYVAINSERDYDVIYFSNYGGVNVEENWDKVIEIRVDPLEGISFTDDSVKSRQVNKDLTIRELDKVPKEAREFIKELYKVYSDLNFSNLEVNPFTFDEKGVRLLDLVASLDDCAEFKCNKQWGEVSFPQPFGKKLSKEEKFIKELDSKTGASLKLTILNPKGRIWTLVAGGGASVIYADTIVDLGFGKEMANYGEYSGNPNTSETYQYTATVLDLMTRENDSKGKVLMIGGGIANFTDVANTFKGIIQALKEYKEKLKKGKIKIFVRRGGPNYSEGLKMMEKLGNELGVPIEIYGPETHMTKIVPLAMKAVGE